MINFVNLILAAGAVGGQIFIVLLAVSLITSTNRALVAWVGGRAMPLSFLVACFATLGSLFYSAIAHYLPCELCWVERAVLYPQIPLFGAAFLKKFKTSKHVANIGIALSFIGALVSAYHSLLQMGVVSGGLCAALGPVSCAKVYVLEFGYITMPLMACTAFLLVAVLLFAKKSVDKRAIADYAS